KAKQKHIEEIIKKEVQTVVKGLKKKKISLAYMQYINNRVLIPRVEYRAQQHILPRE
ncbi:22839_t:CDS:1, partial [Racocetra persica]